MGLILDGTTGISASGNIYGANIIVTENFSPAAVSVTGNVQGAYILGNGSLLTGIDTTSIQNGTSNVRVTSSGGNITMGVNGNGNVVVVATSGLSVFGSVGAYGSIQSELSVKANGTMSASGNVFGGNFLTGGYVSATGEVVATGDVSGGNIRTFGFVSATGNVNGDYIIGNGSQLTGINATALVFGNSISIGANATANATAGIAIGGFAGNTSQQSNAISIGQQAGRFSQSSNTIAMGFQAGYTTQSSVAIAIGQQAGYLAQKINAVAIGGGSGYNAQGANTVAAGFNAAGIGQGNTAIAVGYYAGVSSQGSNSIAIGGLSGAVSQGGNSIAIGFSAAGNTQGSNAVAIGTQAAYSIQGNNSIAIGQFAGYQSLTANSIAIGYGAANNNSAENIIVLNATGANLTGTTANALYVAPIRNDAVTAIGNVLVYNTTTKEVAYSNTLSVSGNITGAALTVSTGNITGGNIVNANANGVGNIGSSTTYFNTVFAKATSAQYADLAEKYTADAEYEPGTVVSFGGDAEVTKSTVNGDRRVAGVISTNPSYIMNSGLEGTTALVALTGRVPTKVTGTVRKGDLMVSNGDGSARAEDAPATGSVIGKSLVDFDGETGTIEIVVGRL